MKSTFRIVCFALLTAASVPVWALQLGQIQVKSALNQPLVAAIPLHPENLTELDGLTVALAPAADFKRAGLQLTPTDLTLQFHVVTDNNGQKLILVTSSEPITDPYLDFLVQVNTRQGRQVREFVVLLNPVIAAPAPVVQAAPVASMPAGNGAMSQPAELPPASAFPQPAAPPASKPAAAAQSLEMPPPLEIQPQPQPRPQSIPTKPQPQTEAKPQPKTPAKPQPKSQAKPAKAQAKPQPKSQPKPESQPTGVHAGETLKVAHGDTLYGIAKQQTQGTNVSINQLMLALKSANPEAFFKNNINDLKAGAILRIPTRDAVDRVSVAEADAEVRRQYEAWRIARPHTATVVEGTAAEAAANAAPKPAGPPAADHLTLVPPAGGGGGASNRPGITGGTGKETVTGLQQRLQNSRDTLVSLNQSNADLESRVRSLEDITGKTGKLLSLKDATIAELQHKLAAMQSGAVGASSIAQAASAGAVHAGNAQASKTEAAANSSAPPKAAGNPETNKTQAAGTAWYMRPLTWLIAGLIVLALILIGLFGRRRGSAAPAITKGPLPDPADIASSQQATSGEEALFQARIAKDPGDLAAHLALCRLYYTRGDAQGFVVASTAMYAHVTDPAGAEWREVTTMGDKLAQDLPSFETQTAPHDDPYGLVALREPANDDAAVARAPSSPNPEPHVESGHVEAAGAARDPDSETESMAATALTGEPDFTDDPIDTKLDLARAYLDMGDPVGARAMLEEVLEEGSQTQKDEATRLLAEVSS